MSSFFSSRWIDQPKYLVETEGFPEGFRAAVNTCGLKGKDIPDLGLLVCDASQCTSAVRFTRSGVLAAPILAMKDRCDLDSLRAVIVNSGNANCATGRQGLDNAFAIQNAVSNELDLVPEQVGLASTGVIGVQLPVGKITSSIFGLKHHLSRNSDIQFAEAICTTDAFVKAASFTVNLPSGTVKLAAQAKGAGMISPSFATMLCFIQTDAKIGRDLIDKLLGSAVKNSFELISVDGQLSTNDTVIISASGYSKVDITPESEDEKVFLEALTLILKQLALLIVKDGEGAKRVGRIRVCGSSDCQIDQVARAIANSPLVKTALFGGDPNWGRIIGTIGMVLPGKHPLNCDIWIEDIQVCSQGALIDYDSKSLDAAVQRDEVEYRISFGKGDESEIFFSDLSYDYVKINAEYTT